MLLLIGFPEDEVERVREMYADTIPVSAEMEDKVLENIIRERKHPENYQVLGSQRIVIMHDIPKEELSKIINNIRKKINAHIIFATSTPTSLKWKIGNLMEELLEEDRYFREKRAK